MTQKELTNIREAESPSRREASSPRKREEDTYKLQKINRQGTRPNLTVNTKDNNKGLIHNVTMFDVTQDKNQIRETHESLKLQQSPNSESRSALAMLGKVISMTSP